MKITMDGEYQTRDGEAVRVLAVDIHNEVYPVAAAVIDCDGDEEVHSYTAEGLYYATEGMEEAGLDLEPKQKTVFVNLHENGNAYWYKSASKARDRSWENHIAVAVEVSI